MERQIELIREALSHAGEDRMALDRLERHRITPDCYIQPMQFLFRLFNKPCFPRGELVALTGKAKSGKTFVASMLMSLCFRPDVLQFRRTGEELSLLWVDTEQSEESTQDILRDRIMPMIGGEGTLPGAIPFDAERFHIFNLRGEFWQERMPLLDAAMLRFHPDLVILDGIRDLVNDINDGVMAQSVIEHLMQLASQLKCCIVCVLHQNKAAEDKTLRGWLGTELKNKAFECYECLKDEMRIFSFQQTDTRKFDIPDKMFYTVGGNGIPSLYQMGSGASILGQNAPAAPNNGSKAINPYYISHTDEMGRPIIKAEKLFRDVMKVGELVDEETLVKRVAEKANIQSRRLCFACLIKCMREGVVRELKDSSGQKFYQVSRPDTVQSTDTTP